MNPKINISAHRIKKQKYYYSFFSQKLRLEKRLLLQKRSSGNNTQSYERYKNGKKRTEINIMPPNVKNSPKVAEKSKKSNKSKQPGRETVHNGPKMV